MILIIIGVGYACLAIVVSMYVYCRKSGPYMRMKERYGTVAEDYAVTLVPPSGFSTFHQTGAADGVEMKGVEEKETFSLMAHSQHNLVLYNHINNAFELNLGSQVVEAGRLGNLAAALGAEADATRTPAVHTVSDSAPAAAHYCLPCGSALERSTRAVNRKHEQHIQFVDADKHGQAGAHGKWGVSSGSDGQPGGRGKDGHHAQAQVHLKVGGNLKQINITDSVTGRVMPVRMDQGQGILFIECSGGNGGSGGDGGAGAQGYTGRTGSHGFSGSNGGRGGTGGPGGDGGTGGDAGAGGDASELVIESTAADSALLALVEADVRFGRRGAPGVGGAAGPGGAGGQGGPGGRSTKNRSAGSRGPRGANGSPGHRGHDGQAAPDGKMGSVMYRVGNEQGDRFNAFVEKYAVRDSDNQDGVIEPNSNFEVGNLTLRNTGDITFPGNCAVIAFPDTSTNALSMNERVTMCDPLPPGQALELKERFTFVAPDMGPPPRNTNFRYELSVMSDVSVYNRSLPEGWFRSQPIVTEFPIQIKSFDVTDWLGPAEQSTSMICISNISDIDYGADSKDGSEIEVRVTTGGTVLQLLAPNKDASASYTVTPEGTGVVRVPLLRARSQVFVKIGMGLGAQATEMLYCLIPVQAVLRFRGRVLCYFEREVRITPTYDSTHRYDVLFVTSASLSQSEFLAYGTVFQLCGLSFATYDIERYKQLCTGDPVWLGLVQYMVFPTSEQHAPTSLLRWPDIEAFLESSPDTGVLLLGPEHSQLDWFLFDFEHPVLSTLHDSDCIKDVPGSSAAQQTEFSYPVWGIQENTPLAQRRSANVKFGARGLEMQRRKWVNKTGKPCLGVMSIDHPLVTNEVRREFPCLLGLLLAFPCFLCGLGWKGGKSTVSSTADSRGVHAAVYPSRFPTSSRLFVVNKHVPMETEEGVWFTNSEAAGFAVKSHAFSSLGLHSPLVRTMFSVFGMMSAVDRRAKMLNAPPAVQELLDKFQWMAAAEHKRVMDPHCCGDCCCTGLLSTSSKVLMRGLGGRKYTQGKEMGAASQLSVDKMCAHFDELDRSIAKGKPHGRQDFTFVQRLFNISLPCRDFLPFNLRVSEDGRDAYLRSSDRQTHAVARHITSFVHASRDATSMGQVRQSEVKRQTARLEASAQVKLTVLPFTLNMAPPTFDEVMNGIDCAAPVPQLPTFVTINDQAAAWQMAPPEPLPLYNEQGYAEEQKHYKTTK